MTKELLEGFDIYKEILEDSILNFFPDEDMARLEYGENSLGDKALSLVYKDKTVLTYVDLEGGHNLYEELFKYIINIGLNKLIDKPWLKNNNEK